MKCPYCGYQESKVVDSRHSDDGLSIRRRRECLQQSIALRGKIIFLLLNADIFKEPGKRHTERSGDF